jgi:hypothetical protein
VRVSNSFLPISVEFILSIGAALIMILKANYLSL